MAKLKELSFEFRSGIYFGAVALVLSFFTGILAGVGITVTAIRALIMTLVFIGVGYGAMTVIRKRVPELYEVFVSEKAPDEVKEVGEDEFTEEPDVQMEPAGEPPAEDSGEQAGFTEFKPADYDRLQTVGDSGLDNELNTGEGKMGKHIIVEEQFNGYEPKLMAEAVRTMMGKDKD